MKYRHRVLVLLFLLSMITYFDRVAIAVAGTEIQRDLGLSASQWGWVLGIFALSYALFEIPTGSLGDRIGPRKVLTRIVIWWSGFTTLTGAAPNYGTLLATRFAFGMGEAGAYPNASSSISKWFPVAERARAQGTVWMASRLGGALTPLIVVPIVALYGWRNAFYLFGLIGVIWAIVWYWWYRDYPTEKAGVTPEEIEEIGSGSSRRAHEGLPWGRAIRSRNLWKIMVMYHTYCWGAYFYLTWMPTYLRVGRGFSASEMQIYAMLPFLAGALGNIVGGSASDLLTRRRGLKVGRLSVGTAGLAVSALCILGTALTPNRYAAVGLLTFGFFAMDTMLPVSWALCLDVGRKYAGAVTGAMNMAGQIGAFISSVAFGMIVDGFGGRYDIPLMLFSAMLAISAVIYTRIDPTVPVVPEETPGAPIVAGVAGRN